MSEKTYTCESCDGTLMACEDIHGRSYQCTDHSCLQVYDAAEVEGDDDYVPAQPMRPTTKTLRDEFAMAALTGMACGFRTMDEWPEYLMADAAYRYADAMMQEREKVDE